MSEEKKNNVTARPATKAVQCDSAKGGGIPKETLNAHSSIKRSSELSAEKAVWENPLSRHLWQMKWHTGDIKWALWMPILPALPFRECMD